MDGWKELFEGVKYKPTNGESCFLWHDVWAEDFPFRSQFPSMFGLAINREAKIYDHLDRGGGGVVLDVPLNGVYLELETYENFLEILYLVREGFREEDGRGWK